jgi:predicted nuclease of restriction endonuclease-like (RecB) superfamily
MAFVPSLRNQIQTPEYQENIIVSPLVTQLDLNDIRQTILAKITWTNHLIILARTNTNEEKEFYIHLCIKENYSKRELERQINSGLFERVMIGNTKLTESLREIHPGITNSFKDSYIFEYLNLSESYSERDLQKGLIKQMKNVILELGKDFLFIDEEYRIQVGNSDFYIDLLFYHRGLHCLVAFELKADKFKPSQLGQLNFYLEALDRDVKKQDENPSIGVLLCKDKDNEVVEYALSRSLSPTMISEYKTQLPDKKLLQQKLHELFENNNEIE